MKNKFLLSLVALIVVTFTCFSNAKGMDSNNAGVGNFDPFKRIYKLLVVLASAKEEMNSVSSSEGSDKSGNLSLSTQVSVASSLEPDPENNALEYSGPMISTPDDLYALLGVECTASDAEIKKAYRMLCSRFHPDVNDPSYKGTRDYKKFIELQQAITTLSDPLARKMYDNKGIVEGYEINFSPLRLTARASSTGGVALPLDLLD